MQGMSERQYAAHVGRGGDPEGERPSAGPLSRRQHQRGGQHARGRNDGPVRPEGASAEAEAGPRCVRCRHAGNRSGVPAVGGGTTFLQAKTANEVLKAQERHPAQKLRELVERAVRWRWCSVSRGRNGTMVNWPARGGADGPSSGRGRRSD